MNSTPLKNADCRLGRVDAWDESGTLESQFLRTTHFQALARDDWVFLFGRRGAGKSALAIASEWHTAWELHRVIAGETAEYGSYLETVRSIAARRDAGLSIDIQKFCELTWTVALPIVISQALCDTGSGLDAVRRTEIDELRKWLDEQCVLDEPFGVILDSLSREALQQVDLNSLDGTQASQYLLQKLQDARHRNALASIEKLTRNRKTLLLVLDSLESYRIHDSAIRDALRGIVAATRSFARRFTGIGLRLFMPAEIYSDVAADMPGKVRDSSRFLRWQAQDLFLMIALRYVDFLDKHGLIDAGKADSLRSELVRNDGTRRCRDVRNDFWYANDFLPAQIRNGLGFSEDTLAYILRHTQRRPRQLITVFNSIIRHAFDQSEDVRISEESVVNGVHSDESLLDTLNEIFVPFLDVSEGVIDDVRAAFAGRSRVMTGRSLKQFAKAIYDTGHVRSSENVDFLQLMLRSGLVGRVDNPPPHRNDTSGYCVAQFEYMMRDRICLRDDQWYFVHPILGDALSMSRGNECGAVYPKPLDDLELESAVGIPID